MLRRLFKKQVRILGRSISLGTLLLVLTTVTVLAWGVWYAFQASGTASVTFQDAPSEITVVITANCSHDAGAGQSNGNAVISGNDVTCSFSGINETSAFALIIMANNNSSGVPVTLDIDSLDPSPCLTMSDNGPVAIAAGASGSVRIDYAGNGSSFNCGGLTQDFVAAYSVTP